MKTKMTLDKLAVMTKRGFDETEKRLGNRIDNMGNRIDNMERKMDKRFSEMDTRFTELESKIETYTQYWHRKYNEHEIWLQNLDRSVATLERRINGKR
ncbi:MAG: hypothetical protein AAB799_02190 [Patescibacteria group bacterium]